jgi:hypothetical protein
MFFNRGWTRGDVTLTVNLGGATVVPNKVLSVFGNYNDALFSNSTVFSTVLNRNLGINLSENGTNTPGGGTGLDFQINFYITSHASQGTLYEKRSPHQ